MIWLIIGAAGALLFAAMPIGIGHAVGRIIARITKRP